MYFLGNQIFPLAIVIALAGPGVALAQPDKPIKSGDEVPVLRRVELAADLLCARTRRVIRQFAAQSSSADSAKADDNIATLNDATTQMVGEVIQFLQVRPVACEPSR